MPASSEPGTASPRGTVAPQAKTIAAYSARSSAAVTSGPASTQHRNSVPSASIWMRRRSRCRFSILNSGIPYRGRPPRRYPALGPGPVDDFDLDLLDGDRVGADAEHARRLARGRTQPAGELGEVVSGVQSLGSAAPVSGVDQVVPLRDQVAERAARVAERDAAVHAPAGLALELVGAEFGVHLSPVGDANVDRSPARRLPRRGQEAPWVSHVARPQPLAADMTASLTSMPSRSARRAAASTRS